MTARGTSQGLVLRLDSRVEERSLLDALHEFMEPRRLFLKGNEVRLEWVGDRPTTDVVERIGSMMRDDYQIVTIAAEEFDAEAVVDQGTANSLAAGLVGEIEVDEELDRPTTPVRSLFDGVEQIGAVSQARKSAERSSISDPSIWDDADARMVYSTVRAGQKIETEHTLVIIGDVNPGAEIIAGGDIIVLGSLRGIAHAGAYDENGGGRVIFALNLQPTQLRIGTVISRGSSEARKVPEMARVEGTNIMVESFQARSTWFRRWA